MWSTGASMKLCPLTSEEVSQTLLQACATSYGHMPQTFRAGRCAVCGKDKSNLSDHHVLDLDGKKTGMKLVICRDCHDVLEQYRYALERLNKKS